MVLVFLVSLALLVCTIVAELERPQEAVPPGGGSCPACSRGVEADWLLCPHCRTLLQQGCDGCGRQVSVCHRHCPACGAQRERGR